MKSIYELKLHECTGILPKTNNVSCYDFTVMRVPGGWIYMVWDNEEQRLVRELFVEYNNEFQQVKK